MGLVVAFNSVIFLSFVLSGFGSYRLAAYVTGSHAGGLIAGLIFAFMPFHFLNISCLNLLAIEFLPFYILSLLKLWDRPTVRQGFLVAIWLALAFYTSLDYALYLLIFSILWLLYRLTFKFSDFDRRFLNYLALAAFSFIVFTAPLLLQQATFSHFQGSAIKQDVDQVVFWSPALLSFITPSALLLDGSVQRMSLSEIPAGNYRVPLDMGDKLSEKAHSSPINVGFEDATRNSLRLIAGTKIDDGKGNLSQKYGLSLVRIVQ